MARLAAIEARLAALEGSGAPRPQGPRAAPPEEEALSDRHLDKPWADKKIAKDPKDWTGPTQVGRAYSRAPVQWLEMQAAFYEWKANKGRTEIPVRLRNDGKPWHETDTFEAKLCRGWAIRNAKKLAAKAGQEELPPPDGGGTDDNGCPF